MYNKNLSEDLRLRLSKTDMDFLRQLSEERCVSVSECIRSIIGEYRRSLDTIAALQKAMVLMQDQGKEGAVHGDTKTDIDDLL